MVTELILGSVGALKSADPSIILGYAICGFIAFIIMRQLLEMIVEEPVAGSFSQFAHNYWGGFAGFLSGMELLDLVHPGWHVGTDSHSIKHKRSVSQALYGEV